MFKPKFTITPAINQRIAKIEKLKTQFDMANILPELELQLRFRATVESVHSSTSIEGNPLNEQEVRNLLHGDSVNAADYAIKEVLNYKKAFDWLNNHSLNGEFFSIKQILQTHKLLMQGLLPKEKVGAWRPGSVYVIDELDGQEIIQYQGPNAEDLPKLLKTFLKWLEFNRDQYHPILLAGLIHFIFVSIHPFSDGNGRMTRLLTQQFLKSAAYDFRGTLSLDVFYLQNRQSYYQALSCGQTFDERMTADLSDFMDFFTKGFLYSVQSVSKYIKAGRLTDNQGAVLRLNQLELQILDFVYEFGSITTAEAISVTQSTKRTTQRRLMSLVENKILKIEGKGPAVKYLLKN